MGDRTPKKGQLRPDQRVPVTRLLPTEAAEPLVRWFWVPEWDLPKGAVHEALTLPFPACQLVAEPDGVHVYGPVTRAWRRSLTGRGWAVGALLTPGAAHALVGEVASLRDRVVPAEEAVEVGYEIATVMDRPGAPPARHDAAVDLLQEWVVDRVGGLVAADAGAISARRLVDLADGDPGLVRADELAQRLSMSVRTVQRLARTHVGMSPAAMIRRRRLQEAAERVRQEPETDLASIAVALGYSDHAHLTRDFRRILGFTPTGYRAERGQPPDG